MTDDRRLLLLDTSSFSRLIAGSPAHASAVADADLVISFVTVGEVLSGAIKAGWGPRRMAELETRLAAVGVVPGTISVARAYGRLRAQFWTTKQRNDMWIIATAMALPEQPTVVSDDGDFDEVCKYAGISLIHPLGPVS